jgi:hypothetical protein
MITTAPAVALSDASALSEASSLGDAPLLAEAAALSDAGLAVGSPAVEADGDPLPASVHAASRRMTAAAATPVCRSRRVVRGGCMLVSPSSRAVVEGASSGGPVQATR